jgi:hypothetical protein
MVVGADTPMTSREINCLRNSSKKGGMSSCIAQAANSRCTLPKLPSPRPYERCVLGSRRTLTCLLLRHAAL